MDCKKKIIFVKSYDNNNDASVTAESLMLLGFKVSTYFNEKQNMYEVHVFESTSGKISLEYLLEILIEIGYKDAEIVYL